jgi:uncharacterized protein (DUF58 family)
MATPASGNGDARRSSTSPTIPRASSTGGAQRGSSPSTPPLLLNGSASTARPGKSSKPWKRYFRTTREGKAFIFVTGGVGLAAINTGNNLLFLIFGFMLSLIVLSGIMSEIALRDLRLSRRLPARAFARTTCLVELELENKKQRAASYSLEVEDLSPDSPSERRCYFLKVAQKSVQVAGYRRVPHKRGLLRLTGFRVATRYPFGIIEKWRLLDAPDDMLVYPELKAEDLIEAEQNVAGADTASSRIGFGTELAGLRNYQAGDEMRSVHWKRSASLGKLVVMERHRDTTAHLTVLLDNGRPKDADEAWHRGFERAVSRAAALSVTALRRDLSVEVICRGMRSAVVMPGSAPDAVLRFLALLNHVDLTRAEPMATPRGKSRVVDIRVNPVNPA